MLFCILAQLMTNHDADDDDDNETTMTMKKNNIQAANSM